MSVDLLIDFLAPDSKKDPSVIMACMMTGHDKPVNCFVPFFQQKKFCQFIGDAG